jgi:glycerol-3-phosphate acyltransferase PlsX
MTNQSRHLSGNTASERAVRIALDAMGGDNAPGVNIEGVILALQTLTGVDVALVGDEPLLRAELFKRNYSHPCVSIRHAAEAIGMEEAPSVALRKKRNSSIHVGITMVRDGEADAFVSAGNTGAVMAVAAVILRTLEGIDRAAIAIPLPTITGHTVLLDAGANASCKAFHLYQFGIMGSIYAEYALGDKRPKVGLLSIGEEETKGNDVTREAFEMLTKSSLNFIGNAEAKLLYKGVADVVVCDGFTGNIALKISESLAEMINSFLKQLFRSNWRAKLGYLLLKPYLETMKKRLDHAEVGGAPLLGINGAVFISHGSSCPRGIKSALTAARRFIAEDVNGHIKESLAQNRHILDPKKLAKQEKPSLLERVKRGIGVSGAAESEET